MTSHQKDTEQKSNLQGSQSKGKELASTDQSRTKQPSKISPNKDPDSQNKDQIPRDLPENRDNVQRDVDNCSSFNLETGISKLKVSIPLTDGALGKDRACIGIWIRSPHHHQQVISLFCAYNLAFYYTTNEVEHGALITGLKILNRLGA